MTILFASMMMVSGINNDAFWFIADSFSINDDSFSINDDSFSINDDSFSINDDAFSINDDAFSINDDAFCINGDALRFTLERPSETGVRSTDLPSVRPDENPSRRFGKRIACGI